MTKPNTEAWKEEFSGRERVRMVVETLEEPATVSDIANRADVAWGTADSELENLLAEQRVEKHAVDNKTKYGPNPVQMLIEEVLDLIDENTRDELESTLVEYTSQVESLQDKYEVETVSELRDDLVEEGLSADEMREIRNVASTWDTLESEIRLTKHALQLYDDVSRLSDSNGDGRLAIA
jgi:predicted transcriptional regulator